MRERPISALWPASARRSTPASKPTRDPWPEEAGVEANDTRATWAMHVAARRALGAATKLLGKAGVPSLAVEGVVTAYGLYEEPRGRPIGEDVRIRRRISGGRRGRSRGSGAPA
jgi:hypothetical protein